MTRGEAAARKFADLAGGGPVCALDRDYSGQIIGAADIADAENNVFRITMDETTVERMARAICAAEFPEINAEYAWNVQFEDGQNHYRRVALAALTAAVNGG